MNRDEIITTLKRLGVLAALLIAAVMVISAVENKQVSTAGDLLIEIEPLYHGRFLIDSADVKKTIDRSFGFDLPGQQIGLLDIERLERVLEADPFILDADAFIDAENVIHVEVEQREPMLRIIDNNGLNYYLDAEGNKMPLSRHFSARVLVVTGNLPPHVPDFLFKKQNLLKDVFLLAKQIRENDFMRVLVEQIHVQNGKIVLIPKLGDQDIILGTYEEVETKFEKLKAFYLEAVPHKGWRKYKAIDLQYKDQVVAKKR